MTCVGIIWSSEECWEDNKIERLMKRYEYVLFIKKLKKKQLYPFTFWTIGLFASTNPTFQTLM